MLEVVVFSFQRGKQQPEGMTGPANSPLPGDVATTCSLGTSSVHSPYPADSTGARQNNYSALSRLSPAIIHYLLQTHWPSSRIIHQHVCQNRLFSPSWQTSHCSHHPHHHGGENPPRSLRAQEFPLLQHCRRPGSVRLLHSPSPGETGLLLGPPPPSGVPQLTLIYDDR